MSCETLTNISKREISSNWDPPTEIIGIIFILRNSPKVISHLYSF